MNTALTQAIDHLRQEPHDPVTLEVAGMRIEIRYKGEAPKAETNVNGFRSANDLFADLGSWEGETADELILSLRAARDAGGSKEPPVF